MKLSKGPGRIVTAVMAMAIMCAVSTPVVAQVTPGQVSEPQTFTFDEDDIPGEFIKPGGEGFNGTFHPKTESLIKVRQDFIPEILQSTSDVGP